MSRRSPYLRLSALLLASGLVCLTPALFPQTPRPSPTNGASGGTGGTCGALGGDLSGTCAAATVVDVNGGAMPPSAAVLGTNSSGQPISVSVGPAALGAGTFAAQTDGTTVTWAIASVLNANATLLFTAHSGSRTLAITNPVIGGNYVLRLTQDATGGEGLTLGTGCTWKVIGGGSGAVTPSTGAAAVDVLAFTYDGTNCLTTFGKNYN